MSPIFFKLKIQLPYPPPPLKKTKKNDFINPQQQDATEIIILHPFEIRILPNVTNDSGRPASQKQSRSNFEPFTATTMRWLKTSQPKPHDVRRRKFVEGKAPVLMEFFHLQWWSGLYLYPLDLPSLQPGCQILYLYSRLWARVCRRNFSDPDIFRKALAPRSVGSREANSTTLRMIGPSKTGYFEDPPLRHTGSSTLPFGGSFRSLGERKKTPVTSLSAIGLPRFCQGTTGLAF